MLSDLKRMLLLGTAGVLFPQQVDACACCDGYKERTPLAWNKDNLHLYVIRDTTLSCENLWIMEIWKRGENTVQGCLSQAEESTDYIDIPCRDETGGYLDIEDQYKEAVKIWGAGENFINQAGLSFAQLVDPSMWRVNIADIHKDGKPSDEHRIRLEILLNGQWMLVHDVVRSEDSIYAGGVQVQVWHTPDPNVVLVEYEGEGMSSSQPFTYEDRFEWITLPGALYPLKKANYEVVGTSSDVKEPWLNLRKKPSSKSNSLAKLPDGTWLEVLDKKGDWRKVRVRSGPDHFKEGWVHQRYLSLIQE